MKKIKRVLSFVLSAVMLLSLMIIPAAAVDNMTISAGTATANAGGTVSVNLNIANNPGVAALQINVYYKSNVLSCTAATPKTDAAGSTTTWKTFSNDAENASGLATVDNSAISAERKAAGWKMITFGYTVSDAAGFNLDGTIGSITFKVADAAESCTTPLEVEIVKAHTPKSTDVEVTAKATANGSIAINGALPTITTLKLDGAAAKTVNVDGTTGATVNATAASAIGTDITTGVKWTVSPADKGVAIGESTGVITVGAKAAARDYIVTASAVADKSQGTDKTITLTVARADSQPADIVLSLPTDPILVPADGVADANTIAVPAKVTDQYGDDVTSTYSSQITWEITPPVTGNNLTANGITLAAGTGTNAGKGIVSVTNAAKTLVTSTASYQCDIHATLTGTPGGTAFVNIQRAASVASSVDLAYEYGSGNLDIPTITSPSTVNETVSPVKATVKDQYGATMTGASVSWALAPAADGVSINPANGQVTLSNSAAANLAVGAHNFTVTVTYGDGKTDTKDFTITRAASVATYLNLYTDSACTTAAGATDTIGIDPTNGSTRTYYAKVFDQYGIAMTTQPTITWSLGDGAAASISVANGTVTVASTAADSDKATVIASDGTHSDSVALTARSVDLNWDDFFTLKDPATITYGDDAAAAFSKISKNGTATAYTSGTATPVNGTFSDPTSTDLSAGDGKTITVTFTVPASGSTPAITLTKTYFVDVAKKTVTVTPNSNQSKVYGEADPTALTYTLDDTDAVVTGALARATGEHVGAYAISLGTLALNATSAANYTLAFSTTPVNFNITKVTITNTYVDTSTAEIDARGAYIGEGWTDAHARNEGPNSMKASITSYAQNKASVVYGNDGYEQIPMTLADTTDTFNVKGRTYTFNASIAGSTGGTTDFESYTAAIPVTLTIYPDIVTAVKQDAATALPTQITVAKSEVLKSGQTLTGLGLPESVYLVCKFDDYFDRSTSATAAWDKTMTDAIAAANTVTATSGDKTVTFTLTDAGFPWATMPTTPVTIKLVITDKYPVDVTVTAPASITYGDKLDAPSAEQTEKNGHGTDTANAYTYLYEGTTAAGTKYSSATPPTDAGTYTVTATLVSDTHAGSGTSDTFTIAKKEVGVTFTNPESLVYDGSAKTVTAAVTDAVAGDDVTAALTYTQTAPTAGTAASAAPVNAGTYTVAAALTGAKAANYTLNGAATETLTIAKADRYLSVVPSGFTALTIGSLTVTIVPTYDDADKSAKVSFMSSNPAAATVNAAGVVTAVANSSEPVMITVSIPETTNYNADVSTAAAVRAIPQPIVSAAADGGTDSSLTATVSGTTITVTGAMRAGKKLTVTPSVLSGAPILADSVSISDVTADALKNGTILPVLIGMDPGIPVTYTVNTSGVTLLPANVKLTEEHENGTVADTITGPDAASLTTALTDSKTVSSGLDTAASAALVAAAQKVAAANPTVANVTAAASLKFEATAYDSAANTLDLTVTPQVAYMDGDTVLVAAADIPAGDIKTPFTANLVLPDGFLTDNLYAKVTAGSTTTVTKVTVTAGVASWLQSGPAAVELYTDVRSVTVNFHFDNGSTQAVTYKADSLNTALPTDSKSGYSFDGWLIGGTLYRTVNEALLNLNLTPPVDATPKFTVISSGGGSISANAITVKTTGDGTVTPSANSAYTGDTVKLTVAPGTGSTLDTITVTDKNGNTVPVTKVNDNTYTFTMPASKVTVNAAFKTSAKDVSDIFKDVPKELWSHDYIQYAYDHDLFKGTSDTTFEPETTMTRGMLVTVLYRLEGSPAVTTKSGFTDVAADMWYSDAVAWASANGIVNGYGDGTFGPNDTVTREQMAAILYRYAGFKGYDTTQGGMAIREFADYDSISAYALGAMQWAVNAKLMEGSNNMLTPTAGATRAQVAAVLQRFIQNIVK